MGKGGIRLETRSAERNSPPAFADVRGRQSTTSGTSWFPDWLHCLVFPQHHSMQQGMLRNGSSRLLVKAWHGGSLQVGTSHLDIHLRLVWCKSRPAAVVQGEDDMSLARMCEAWDPLLTSHSESG